MQLFYNELICWVRGGALPVGHWHFVWVTDDKSERFVCLRVCHGEDQSCQAVIASFEIKPPFTRGPGRSLLTGISWLWFCSSAKALSALPAQGTAVWQLEQGTQLWASSGEKQTQVSLLVFYVQAEVVMEHHPCSLVENTSFSTSSLPLRESAGRDLFFLGTGGRREDVLWHEDAAECFLMQMMSGRFKTVLKCLPHNYPHIPFCYTAELGWLGTGKDLV